MAEVLVEVGKGMLSIPQMEALHRCIGELDKAVWHYNDCGCCVTVHGPDCAYVIGRDGESDFYPQFEFDCGCES